MTTCTHCGVAIQWMNYAIGQRWMHCPPGTELFTSSSAYAPYEHCKTQSVAEPVVGAHWRER